MKNILIVSLVLATSFLIHAAGTESPNNTMFPELTPAPQTADITAPASVQQAPAMEPTAQVAANAGMQPMPAQTTETATATY